jgi:TonB family protein
MVCRASCGSSVPDPGSKLRTEGSFTGLCVRSGETMRCQDARNDPRVNAAACQALGIRSMVVVPLRGQRKVAGVLAVFSKTAQAFSSTHVSILQTLGEVIEALLREGGSLPSGAQVQPPSPMRLAEALRRAAEEDAPPKMAAFIGDVSADAHSDHAATALQSKPPAKKIMTHPSPTAPPRPVPAQRAMPVEPIHEPSLPVERVEPGHELVVPVAEAVEPTYHEHEAHTSSSAANEDEQVLVVSGKAKTKTAGNMMVVGAVLVTATMLAVGAWVLYVRASNSAEASASALTTEPAANVGTPAAPTNTPAQQPVRVPLQPVTPRNAATTAASTAKEKPGREAVSAEPDPREMAPVVVVNELPKGLRGPGSNGEEPPEAPTLTVADSSLPALSRPISMPVSGPQASKLVPGKPIHRVMPQYPEIAKRLRLEGVVVLHAVVSPEGNVGDVKVVSGNTLLHNAALAAVKQWRYSPSLLNGKAVESAVEIRLTFQHPK